MPDTLNTETKRIYAYLATKLSQHRLQHSIGVMETMAKLADVYELDKEKALQAGLLHDIAKELKPAAYERIVEEARIEIRCEEDKNYHLYLHGPVGAYVAEKELQIKDPVILAAIETHTFYGVYNEAFNTSLHWCLHFSDIIEPNRQWQNIRWLDTNGERLKKLIYSGNLDESAFLFTSGIIKWFTEAKMQIHPNIRRANAALAKKLA